MLDLHLTHALKNGIKYFQDNLDKFKSIMPDISAELAERYHTKFAALEVNFDESFQNKKEKNPLITFRVNDAQRNQLQVMGNAGGQVLKTVFMDHTASINIYVEDLDMARVFQRVVQAALLFFKSDFIRIGYSDITFVKSGQQTLQRQMTSDNVTIYQRTLVYTAQRQLSVELNRNEFDLPWAILPNPDDF